MRPPIRTTGLLAIGILYAAATGALAVLNPILAAAFVAPILWVMLSDLAASYLTGNVVYQLHDDQHRVIYVGETNDVTRRMLEHTDGTEHDWYTDIYGYTIARHCWTDRQCKRIERRRITVINQCARRSWCDRLRNEIYDDNHHKTGALLTVAVWKPLYLAASFVFDSCTFHSPAGLTRTIPQRPEADDELDADEWVEADEPAGTDSFNATYERRSQPSWDVVAPLALPPVSGHSQHVTDARDTTRPPMGGSCRPDRVTCDSDSHQGQSIGAQVREAHQRQQATLTDPFPPDLACHLTDGERAGVHLLDADERDLLYGRLRQRKSRANRRNKRSNGDGAARQSNGHADTTSNGNGHQTRPARGRGAGEGE